MRLRLKNACYLIGASLLLNSSVIYANSQHFFIKNTTRFGFFNDDRYSNEVKCQSYTEGDVGHLPVEYIFQQLDTYRTPYFIDHKMAQEQSGFRIYSDKIIYKSELYNRICQLTGVRIHGLGKAWINKQSITGEGVQNSIVSFNTFKDKKGPIDDMYVASQLLALPIAARISGDKSFIDDMHIIVENTGLSNSYNKYAKTINSGSNGVNGNIYGFSLDFTELKTIDNINNFIKEVSIKLAADLNIIDNKINYDELANAIRIETLILLDQEISMEYASPLHVQASLAMKYSGVVDGEWQSNIYATDRVSVDDILNIPNDFYFYDEVNNRLKKNTASTV